jgi:anti-sigma regulatory factor (Ser/Thr protein kinase)
VPAATLSIPADVAQVRTVRLVAVAAARRAGLAEDVVDDVRLAVSEVVARAVLRGVVHDATADGEGDIEVVISDDGDVFRITVTGASADEPDPDDELALALVGALAPEVAADGGTVSLAWPLAGT